MSAEERKSRQIQQVSCAVITVSDTRTPATDEGGRLIVDRLLAAGHLLVARDLVPDEPDLVRARVAALCGMETIHAVLLTGGTGLSPRDTTYEAIAALYDRSLDGFGELFRMLSFEQIGAHAMLSRASAGVCNRCVVFSMPGSPDAVVLAMDRLILPVLTHITGLVRHRE